MSELSSEVLAHLSGRRKAAILVLLMGEEVTGELFRHLSPRDVARIAREVAEIGPVDDRTAEDVLQDYWLEAFNAPQERGGPDAARRILARASISEEIVDRLLGRDTSGDEGVLGPLLEAPPDVLARALQDEHPQTTALVLLHLPPRRAARLLAALPEAARGETVLRMATLRQVRAEVLDEVATSLQERLSGQKGQDTDDGLERTAEVLAKLARHETKRVLEELEAEHPDEVQRLRAEIFTFESLAGADDRGMQELLRSLDTGKIAIALAGCEEALAQRFLDNLSERAAGMLREEMEFLGTPDPREQELVRKEILDVALQLEADDRLKFVEAGGDGSDDDG